MAPVSRAGADTEDVTLEGIARGGGSPSLLRRVRMTVDGEKQRHDAQVPSFELVTADGAVQVELDDASFLVPLERKKARWSALEDEPALAAVRGSAPAPDARVEVAFGEVREGAHVAVKGKAVARAMKGGSFRGPAEARLTHVRARIVAKGETAADARAALAAEIARRTPRERRPAPARTDWGHTVRFALAVVVAAGGVAMLGIAVSVHEFVQAFDFAVAGGGLLLSAPAGLALGRPFVLAKQDGPTAKNVASLLAVIIALSLLPLALIVPFADSADKIDAGKRLYHGPFAFAMWSAWLAYLAGAVWWMSRGTAKLASRVLSAREHAASPEDGAWGLVEGHVADASASFAGTAFALASIFEEEHQDGSSPDLEHLRTEGAPFVVVRDDGSRVHVDPKSAAFASTTRITTGERASASNKKVVTGLELAPAGARVLVLGRIHVHEGPERRLEMASTGGGRLVVYASPRPRAALRWWLLRHRALLFALVVAAAALAALTVHHPFLPDLHSVD